MCFFARNPQKRIAESDVTCYKIVYVHKKKINSYVRAFPYELNKKYFQPIQFYKNRFGSRAEEGFHSYNKVEYAFNEYYGLYIESPYFRTSVDSNERIVKCIIPKGTIYYKNELGEIISESIVIKKIINPSLQLRFKNWCCNL